MNGEPRRNVRLLIEYEGTAYAGWQLQHDRSTVQGAVMRAIELALGEKTTVYGASRTDAGVHARGQVANFRTASGLAAWKIGHALNAHLPEDVAVLEAGDAPAEFHSQFMAKGKHYRYVVRNDKYRSALDRAFCHLVRGDLDLDAMQQGARRLVGTHDFRAMATQNETKKNTTRTMRRVEWVKHEAYLHLEVEGDGFLYNMVRTFVGTLLKIGKGGLGPEDIPRILASKDRRKAGPVAPAKGLFLMKVEY
ncbi:MAG: tRNA pseudouridine(38-40) synthase TruA [Planctomycetes bacterium]|nr:tRNA pseudouridine(38-40) synthase TruA [Planctomycetota bacterium]